MIVGGDRGTAGAIRMCGEAALRSGAGLVRVLTHPENVAPIVTVRPELMVDELTPQTLKAALEWADVVAIGPGLGSANEAQRPCARWKVLTNRWSGTPTRWNLLAFNPDKRHNRCVNAAPRRSGPSAERQRGRN